MVIFSGGWDSKKRLLYTRFREFHNKVPPEKVSLLCRKICVINKPFIENIVYFCLQDICLPEKMIYDKHILM